ncbi:MAG TPA: PLP-dependent aminotransferase family protein [Solirubrobacteraceae bacterium]
MTVAGTTTTGPELLIELDRGEGPLSARLQGGLREAVRTGRLARGERLPSTRTLARDLGVSRRLVVEAYAQLVAEGWLAARQGAGTSVAQAPRGRARLPAPEPGAEPVGRLPYDFFPGSPDLASFPRALWLRTLREVLRSAPDEALHYPDVAGTPELRAALAAHLGRVRGVVTTPERVLVTSGARQGLALLGRMLAGRGVTRIAIEWPTLPLHAEILEAGGLQIARIPVDADGVLVERLEASGAGAVLVTPAHQAPRGVALTPERRAALVAWAQAGERLIVEDDYDAEFRYDRAPLGAVQALAPEHVAYLGSVSKTLAPGLRLGWLALPAALVAPLAGAKALDDGGCQTLDQLTLARLLDTAAYDRVLRAARRRNRARRDALVSALAAELPGTRLEGLAAGLHALARLPAAVDAQALVAAARQVGVGVYPIPDRRGQTDELVLGYACLSEPAIAEGVRRLGSVMMTLG